MGTVWLASRSLSKPEAVVTHIDPGDEQIVALAGHPSDAPIVMVNLNSYRARAAYDSPGPDDDNVSGREAYQRYGEVALRAMAEVGGTVLWGVPTEQVLVGCDHDAYDEVLAVWYPNRAAFLRMVGLDWYRDALVHRTAGLDHATIIACTGPSTPVLATPGA